MCAAAVEVTGRKGQSSIVGASDFHSLSSKMTSSSVAADEVEKSTEDVEANVQYSVIAAALKLSLFMRFEAFKSWL